MPKSRQEFWQAKFESNVNRDRRNRRALKKSGWNVLVVWECEVMKDPFGVLSALLKNLNPTNAILQYDKLPDKRTILKVAESRLQWNLRQSGE